MKHEINIWGRRKGGRETNFRKNLRVPSVSVTKLKPFDVSHCPISNSSRLTNKFENFLPMNSLPGNTNI